MRVTVIISVAITQFINVQIQMLPNLKKTWLWCYKVICSTLKICDMYPKMNLLQTITFDLVVFAVYIMYRES